MFCCCSQAYVLSRPPSCRRLLHIHSTAMPATDYTEQGKQRGQERISAQEFQFHMFRVILSVPVRGVGVNSPPPPEERETHVLHAVFEYKTVYTNSPFVLSFKQHATRGSHPFFSRKPRNPFTGYLGAYQMTINRVTCQMRNFSVAGKERLSKQIVTFRDQQSTSHLLARFR